MDFTTPHRAKRCEQSSGTWLFLIATKRMDLETEILDALQISSADGHSQGKLQLFQLVPALYETVESMGGGGGVERRGKRMGESHSSLSSHSGTHGQTQAARC